MINLNIFNVCCLKLIKCLPIKLKAIARIVEETSPDIFSKLK